MTLGSVLEIKQPLAGPPQIFRCELLALSDDEAVVQYCLEHSRLLHNIELSAGTISVGYFWESRPYNVYHFRNCHGQTLAFYFNISDRTRVSSRQILWRDLVVDVLIGSQGECCILDEQELPIDLEPGLLESIRQTRDMLISQHGRLCTELEQRSSALLM